MWSSFNKERRKKGEKRNGANGRHEKKKREVGRREKKLKYGGMIFCKVFSIVIV